MAVNVGTVFVTVLPDTGKFGAAMASQVSGAVAPVAQSLSSKLARGLSTVGKSMTRYVTLPTVAAGAASVKLATDFNKSMGLIRGLVGTSAKQIEKFHDQVLAMSRDLPQSPQELADALYFVTSSGFKGAEAMEVLKVSAHAAAAGLGETEVIADALTSAINAYGKENITAARAADIMVAAVREGKVEAGSMAPVMGRLIPTAAELGVEFEEVAGALAALSRTGTSAAEGATMISGVFSTLLKPTDQTKELWKEFGLNIESVQKQLEEEGLLSVLATLRGEIGDNAEALGKLFPNVRAMRGFLGLLGKSAEETAQIMAGTADSVGDAEKAFGVAAETSEFKFKAALSSLQATAIQVGEKILPVVEKIVAQIGEWADAFGRLSPEAQEAAIKLALVAALAGPFLRLTSVAIRATSAVRALFAVMSGGAAVAGATQSGTAAVGAAAGAASGKLSGMAAAAGTLLARFTPLGLAIGAVALTIHDLATTAQPAADDVKKVADELLATGESATAAAMNMRTWELESAAAGSTIGGLLDSLKNNPVLGFWGESAQEAGEKASNAFKLAHEEISSRLIAQIDLAKQQGGAFSEATGGIVRTLIAQKKYAEALEILNRGLERSRNAFFQHARRVIDNKQAFDEWAPVLQRTTDLTDGQRTRIGQLIGIVANAGGKISGLARDQLQAAIATGDFGAATRILHTELAKLPGKKSVKIDAPGLKDVTVTVGQLIDSVAALDGKKVVTTFIERHVVTGKLGKHDGGPIFHEGGKVQGLKADEVMAVLQRGEFVMSRDAVQKIGVGVLSRLNRMHFGGPVLHEGGQAGHQHGGGGGGFGQLLEEAARLARALKNAGQESERRTKLESDLSRVHDQLSKRFNRSLDGFSAKFDDASSRIEELASTIESFQSSVTDSVTGFASLTNLIGEETGADPSATLLKFLQDQAAKAGEFSGLIQQLAAGGLHPALLEQLATAGPEVVNILKAIQGAGIGQVNAVWEQITAVAETTAKALTGPLFGKQKKDLQATLDGLNAEFRGLKKTFEGLPKDVRQGIGGAVGDLAKELGRLAGVLKKIPGMAAGGTLMTGGLVKVGEKGPELVRLPGGAQVIPGGAAGEMLPAGKVTVEIGDVTINNGMDEQELENRIASGVTRGFERLGWRGRRYGKGKN